MKALALVVVMIALPAFAAPIDMKKLERLLGLGRTTPKVPDTTVVSSLPWRLMGTMRARNGFSLAAVECSKKSVTLAIGDVHEGVEVMAIEQQHIVVRRDGRLEQISWRPGIPAPPSTPTTRALSRATVNQYLENPAELLKDARFLPAFAGGQLTGFRAQWVKEGSLLSTLGLRSGDVIVKVNGQPLDFSLMQQLHSTRRFEVELERNGQRIVESVELQ